MDPKSSAFVIGIVGAAVTLSAYSQTLVSPTQCIGVGLFVLMFGLLVREAKRKRGDFPAGQTIKVEFNCKKLKKWRQKFRVFSQRRKTTFPSRKRKRNPSTYFNKKTSKFPKQEAVRNR